MVRFSRTIVALATALMLAPVALAQDAPPTKLGFVDVERALYNIAEGKARLAELQEWARPRQQELQRIGDDIAALQQELNSKRVSAGEQELAELNRRLVARQREFEDRQRNARRDFEARQESVLKEIGDKLNKVITTYADSNRFTAVFILKPNDVAYLANSADITDTIIKLYDQTHPYTAGQGKGGK